jgi:hypothetical protein
VRRTVLTFCFIILLCLLFWREILSLSIQGAVRWKLQSHIIFRDLDYRQGRLILDDLFFFDPSCCQVRAERMEIAVRAVRPFSLKISVVRPHVTILKEAYSGFFTNKNDSSPALAQSGLRSVIKESFCGGQHSQRWGAWDMSVEGGTLEWERCHNASLKTITHKIEGEGHKWDQPPPFCESLSLGSFSWKDSQLRIEMEGSSMTAHLQKEGTIQCSFDQISIAPLSHLLSFREAPPLLGVEPLACEGRLSGNILVCLARGRIEGRLLLEDGSIYGNDKRMGASELEWEGQYCWAQCRPKSGWKRIWICDPMKIRLENAYATLGFSQLTHINGTFWNDDQLGCWWELNNPVFSWKGKGFSQSRAENWLECCLKMDQSSIDCQVRNGEECSWSADVKMAGVSLVRFLQDVRLLPEFFQMERGVVNARLLGKKDDSGIKIASVEECHAQDLMLRGDHGSFACFQLKAAAGFSTDGSLRDANLSLQNAAIQYRQWSVSSAAADGLVEDRMIVKGEFSGLLNGYAASGSLQGSLNDFSLCLYGKGDDEESFDAVVDWNASQEGAADPAGTVWTCTKAHVKAVSFDLMRLGAFFPVNCHGRADLELVYVNGELRLLGSGRQIDVTAGDFYCTAEQVSGFSAIWSQASRHWVMQTERIAFECTVFGKTIFIEGEARLVDSLVMLHAVQGRLGATMFAGDWSFSIEKGIPFSFMAERIGGDLSDWIGVDEGQWECSPRQFTLNGRLLEDPSHWRWTANAKVSRARWGCLQDMAAEVNFDSQEGLIECAHLRGNLAIGPALFALRGVELRKEQGQWLFDVRVEHGIWDWGRLAGQARLDENRLIIAMDPKSHLLNEPLQIANCCFASNSIESLQLKWEVRWKQIYAAVPLLAEIDSRFRAVAQAPLEGSMRVEVDIDPGRQSILQIDGIDVRYKQQALPLSVCVGKSKEEICVKKLAIGPLALTCSLETTGNHWQIKDGHLHCNQSEIVWGGVIHSPTCCELNISQVKIDLGEILGCPAPLTVTGKGLGQIRIDTGAELFEADWELNEAAIKSRCLCFDAQRSFHLHFSSQSGLSLSGIDVQIRENNGRLWGSSRIGRIEFDSSSRCWFFRHVHLSMPAASLVALSEQVGHDHPMGLLMRGVDNSHGLELTVDLDCAADGSSVELSVRDGFIPFLGAMRHLQNIHCSWSDTRFVVALSALHNDHWFKIGTTMQWGPSFEGRVVLEDDAAMEPSTALSIDWKARPGEGLIIQSIDGSFCGIEASFHAQQAGVLVGSARLRFDALADILPSRLARVFRSLRMGKGYELKGHLLYNGQTMSASFKGLLSGKQCELLGFQIRTLLTQVEMDSRRVHLFELKASDPAGIAKIDDLLIARDESLQWNISVPDLTLLEFRPSLLQKTGCEPPQVGPLVVRELKLLELRGNLDERDSLTAHGSLHFVNSFKRERTILDLPSDFLGRIIGLDLELLIPVRGQFRFQLKGGRFWLSDLKDAYSEGKRSKFFLVNEGFSPTIDLDGNIHIFVTMKQYVLFKITENFLLTIDGSIESPFFHMQKKSKLLGL